MSIVAILGSSNSHGNTRKLCDECIQAAGADLIDLNDLAISPWDYQGKNVDDGFTQVTEKLLRATDIVFCTPVYWYAMSAQMKTLFDRFSDLITRRKRVGRLLADKRTWLLVSGFDPLLPEGFEVPFKRTSEYFNMIYSGSLYGSVESGDFDPETLRLAREFGLKIRGQEYPAPLCPPPAAR